MLLAAGEGRRMRPLTLQRPKPLLRVRGRPLLDWHLERLAAAGIGDVVINTCWLADQIEAHCSESAPPGLRIHWSREPTCLETGGGIHNALPLLGAAPFLVVNADIYTDYPFDRLLDTPCRLAHLVLVPNPGHHPEGDFALAPETGRVSEADGGRLTFAGISVLHPDLFAGRAPGHFPLAPLLRAAMRQGKVSGELHTGVWSDVGTPERLEALNT